MSLRLRLTTETSIPICVAGVLPETVCGQSLEDVAKKKIWHGNRQVELGQMFDVQRTGSKNEIEWEGNLAAVHWIGQGMSGGRMVMAGNVGRHLGSEMLGGSIHVDGSVSDYAGCEMRGGMIRIEGNAGDWLCAALPGSRSGTNRGTVVVAGKAGNGVGFALRRGTICVSGNSGRLTGWNMLGGTIVVGGETGPMTGKGMERGSIVLTDPNGSNRNQDMLPPTFSESGSLAPVMVKALAKWCSEIGAPSPFSRGQYQLYYGDHLKGGRGEVLIAEA